MEQRQEYKQAFFEVKSDELKDQIAQIQIQKVRCHARNQALLKNIDKAMDTNDSGTNKVIQMRDQLEN
jgi:uncharacterized protein YpiB (UPF0302 family)